MEAVYALIGMALGGLLAGGGVWLGYRIGFEARTGLTPAPLSEPEYGGVVLDFAEYPDAEPA